jgi:hypothetical protein
VTFEEFGRLVDEARVAHPQWFALPADAAPSEDEIMAHFTELGARLPAEYLDFLREFGGGDFAFLAIYSMDRTSDLNIVAKNAAPWLNRADFVAVSDNGAGDYYGFEVRDGRGGSEVLLLDHETGEIRPTGHADFLDFVAALGLQQ